MAVLEVENIDKWFGPNQVLKQVSLSIDSHEISAVCGENGAGKSTLMKVLAGVYSHDAGSVVIDGVSRTIGSPQEAQDLGIAFVSQELSLAPNLSVLENIWLGTSGVSFFHRRRQAAEVARQALDRVGLRDLSLDVPVAILGIGQRQLVEIARMLTRNARILILDEPTASLSEVEIQKIFEALRALKAEGRTIIYITHRLGEIFDICDKVCIMRDGALVATLPTDDTDRRELMALMLGRNIDAIYPQFKPYAGDVVLDVRDLNVPRSVVDLSFEARRGSVLCLAGQVGSGTTEALRALAGLIPEATGRVTVGGKPYKLRSVRRARSAGVQFISDDRARESIFLDLTVEQNLTALELRRKNRLGFISRAKLRNAARRIAAQVGIDGTRMRSRTDELSGGNQQKVAFGREIAAATRGVVLMSEPTRGVDVGARADIYRLVRGLCDRGYTIVMTSSDLEEVMGTSDAVVTMYRGRQVGFYPREELSMHDLLADITHRASGA